MASGRRIVATDPSGFSEIFGKAKRDTVNPIPLPPLETIDRPYPKDEAMLEDALRESLPEMIEAAGRSPDFDDPKAEAVASNYTWGRVFDRVSPVYMNAVRSKAGDSGQL